MEEKKKSSRQFDLEKKSARSFDLEKKSTRSFDLEKEPPADPVTPEVDNTVSKGGDDGSESTSKKWWWIIGLIILVVLAFVLFKACNGNSTEDSSIATDTTKTIESDKDTLLTDSAKVTTPSNDKGVSESTETNNSEESTSTPISQEQPSQTETQPSTKNVSVAGSDIQDMANRVIQGEFGNGSERKQKLGADYGVIQRRVNEMYRKGQVNIK